MTARNRFKLRGVKLRAKRLGLVELPPNLLDGRVIDAVLEQAHELGFADGLVQLSGRSFELRLGVGALHEGCGDSIGHVNRTLRTTRAACQVELTSEG